MSNWLTDSNFHAGTEELAVCGIFQAVFLQSYDPQPEACFRFGRKSAFGSTGSSGLKLSVDARVTAFTDFPTRALYHDQTPNEFQQLVAWIFDQIRRADRGGR